MKPATWSPRCRRCCTSGENEWPSDPRVLNRISGLKYNMGVRFRYLILAILCLWFTGVAIAQDQQPVEQVPTDKSAPPPKDNRKNPPRSDNVPAGESSSKQTQIDVSPPADDAKKHPEAGLGNSASDADEFTPYNPMRAMKDVEVGDFYFKEAELSCRHQPLPRGPGVQASRRRGHLQTGGGVE